MGKAETEAKNRGYKALVLEVDEENIGVTKTGKLAWAYAFGCSYCSGDYETDEKPLDTMKAFTVNHEDMKEKWEKEVIAYAEKLV